MRISKLVFMCALLTTITGCVEQQTPEELACIRLASIDQTVLDLYNSTTSDTQKNIYLQEMGSQAKSNIASAFRTPGISTSFMAKRNGFDELFREPIFEFIAGEGGGIFDGETKFVGYETKKRINSSDIEAYFAMVNITCS